MFTYRSITTPSHATPFIVAFVTFVAFTIVTFVPRLVWVGWDGDDSRDLSGSFKADGFCPGESCGLSKVSSGSGDWKKPGKATHGRQMQQGGG